MTTKDWERLQYFSATETFTQGDRGIRSFPSPEKMSLELMMRLDRARGFAKTPFIITSSYREGDNGEHGSGEAVDIRVRGSKEREDVFESLKKAGFTRRGVYDKHVHAGVSTTRPQGIWGGISN